MKVISYNPSSVGGLSNIYAIPLSDFVKVAINLQTKNKTVIVKDLNNVIELPCFEDRSAFKEVESLEEGGKLYSIEVNGFIPGNTTDVITKRRLERDKWLVLHQDANGSVLLSGTQNSPLLFRSSRTTGGNRAASSGNSYVFYGSTPTPSITIETAEIVEN